ncbi:hypothetical protein MHL30_17580 [Priestia flexa]|uniref:phage tail protein n=1 Tax=Priestia flexa TaxID=86664 RepID=UPI001EF4D9EF|nr:hypothetical protein [Priestia flexa]MCG7314933.1 hypothetical protein [Priestia flexa]
MSLNLSFKISAVDDFSKKMQGIGKSITSMTDAVNASVGKLSDSTVAMASEMTNAYKQAKRDMQIFKTEQLAVDYGFFKLGQSSDQYAGKTGELMAEIEKLGKTQKTITDNMIKNNSIMKGEFFATIGEMTNMSTQAEKISSNYSRMSNPLLSVNQAGLKVADTMNKIANRGHASVLALQMLGPTANMKELYDMQQLINRGVMRFQMVALAAAATSVLAYGAMHKAAMDSVAGYEEAFNRMKSSVREALQPMVDVFGAVMIKVYDFIDTIAQMAIAFNNAHPTMAKVLQGIVMLVPALTLLLSPLAIGIGLLAGFKAAFASVWTMIAPLVTGLAAMSATVWIVAAAIVALTAGLVYLWNTNEGFRNGVITAWEAIKAKAIEVFQGLLTIITPAFEAVKAFVMTKLAEIKAFWDQHGTQIIQAMQNAFAFIQMIVMNAFAVLTPFIQAAWAIIQTVFQTAWEVIKTIVNTAINIVMGLVKVFAGLLTGDFDLMWEGVKQIVSAAWSFLKSIVSIGINFVSSIVKTGLDLVKTIFTTVWEAIKTKVSEVWESIKTKVQAAVDNVKTSVENGFEKLKSAVDTKMNAAKDKIEDIWAKVEAFFEGIDLFQIGKDIIQGLIDGIGSMASAAITKASELASEIKDTIAGAFKVHSPSRWMRDMIGKNLLIGFQIGLDKERRSTLSKVADMTRWMTPAMPTIPQTDTRTPYASTRAPQQQQVIYVTVSNNFDGDDVWNAVESRNAAAYIMNNALRGK